MMTVLCMLAAIGGLALLIVAVTIAVIAAIADRHTTGPRWTDTSSG
jgi:hypothetical protein